MQAVDAAPQIVITAKTLPAPAAERLLDVTLISRRELDRQGSTGLDQALKGVAGVQLFRRSDARSGQPTSQGVTLRALGGNAASRALLILDGVPQSDPFGGWINWPAYDPASLASVRVIRGGGSVAGGPGALAGTISMESREDEGIAALVEAGSRNARALSFYGGTTAGAGHVGLSAWTSAGDGFVPITAATRGPADRESSYSNGGARLRWSTPLAPGIELQANLSTFVDRRERGLAFTANRSAGEDASARLVGKGRWAWSALLYGQRRRFEASAASVSAGRTLATRSSLQYHVPGRAIGWSAELRPPVGQGIEVRLGTDGRRMRGRSDELGSFSAGLATRDRRSGGASSHAGVFAEATIERGLLTLSATARIDRWRITDGFLEERLLSTGALTIDQDYGSRSGWLPTARLAGGIDLGHGLRLRSAAYLGWRLPTLNELFRPFRAGPDATAANPLLEPERLRGLEVGLEGSHGALRWSLTAFGNRLRDPIANVTLATGPGTFPGVGFVGAGGSYRQRQNLDAISVRGLEGRADLRCGPWSVGGEFSLTRARVRATSAAAPLDGLRPAQTPTLSASADVGYTEGGRSLGLQLRHVGAQYEDDLNRILLPSATTVDAFASWPLLPGLRLVGRAENLANAVVVAGRTADGTTERATPRTFWLGLRFAR